MRQAVWPGGNPRRMTLRFSDFSPGLYTHSGANSVPDGAAQNMNHCVTSEGVLRPATGILPLLDADKDRAMIRLLKFAGEEETRILGMTADGRLWHYQGSTPYPICTDIADPANVGWVNYQNQGVPAVIFGTSGTSLLRYDGITVDDLAPGIFPRALALHKERLWMLPADDKMAVCCSDDMAPADWSQTLQTGAMIRILTWDGTACTGLHTVFDDIVIAKERSLWRVVGSSPRDYQLLPIYAARGSIAPRSMAVCDAGLVFLSQEGVFLYDGTRCVDLNNSRIRGMIHESTSFDTACGVFYRDEYLLSMRTSGSGNNCVLAYNFRLGSWSVRTGIYVNDWMLTKGILYCATPTGTGIYGGTSQTLMHNPFACYWESARRGVGPAQKRLETLSVTSRATGMTSGGESGGLQVGARTRDTPWIWRTVRLRRGWNTQSFAVDGMGEWVQLAIRGTKGARFEVSDMTLEMSEVEGV